LSAPPSLLLLLLLLSPARAQDEEEEAFAWVKAGVTSRSKSWRLGLMPAACATISRTSFTARDDGTWGQQPKRRPIGLRSSMASTEGQDASKGRVAERGKDDEADDDDDNDNGGDDDNDEGGNDDDDEGAGEVLAGFVL